MPIREELQNFLNRYTAAYRVSDAAACAAIFVQNAELHSPFAPSAHRRDATHELHRIWTLEAGDENLVTVIDEGSTSELAWCLAAYSEAKATDDGTSLNLPERQADGTWLMHMCSLNSGEGWSLPRKERSRVESNSYHGDGTEA